MSYPSSSSTLNRRRLSISLMKSFSFSYRDRAEAASAFKIHRQLSDEGEVFDGGSPVSPLSILPLDESHINARLEDWCNVWQSGRFLHIDEVELLPEVTLANMDRMFLTIDGTNQNDDDDQDSRDKLHTLLGRCYNLREFRLHIQAGTDIDWLSQLPIVKTTSGTTEMYLYLSGVRSNQTAWASHAVQALIPKCGNMYRRLVFPECDLTRGTAESLLRGIAEAGVKVWGSIVMSSPSLDQEDEEDLHFIAKDLLGSWGFTWWQMESLKKVSDVADLPHDIEKLNLIVNEDVKDNFCNISKIGDYFVNLHELRVHVPVNTDVGCLSSIPIVSTVYLYLPGVGPLDIEWVLQAVEILNGKTDHSARDFRRITFPGSRLTRSCCDKLLRGLSRIGVRVLGSIVVFSNHLDQQDEEHLHLIARQTLDSWGFTWQRDENEMWCCHW
ncbi:unnamed protein product [Meganyctiphanes norvegica]|uniref:Uncharacterized protein n=1 Tax=Meganyctiphanes norvegica TaxID=48144 RepID=A0AAV2S4Q5_MEGNR